MQGEIQSIGKTEYNQSFELSCVIWQEPDSESKWRSYDQSEKHRIWHRSFRVIDGKNFSG